MTNENERLVFAGSDLCSYTIEEVTCTNCIKGFCPARTPARSGEIVFTFCGARKNADEIIAAYNERTESKLVIEKPC